MSANGTPLKIISASLKDENAITNRYETYLEKTLPILNFYKEINLLHQINGMGKIDEIYKEIAGIIAALEA